MYTRLNHLNVTLSYTAVLGLVTQISGTPLKKWIDDGDLFKFVGDNVDKTRGDIRSDHHSQMINMFSLIAVKSRAKGPSPLSQFNHRYKRGRGMGNAM